MASAQLHSVGDLDYVQIPDGDATDKLNKNVVNPCDIDFTVMFRRGGHDHHTLAETFEHAICRDHPLCEPPYVWPGMWRLDNPIHGQDLIPITTYTYEPSCDLWWDPCTVRGDLHPGDSLFITYRIEAGTLVDSIMTHIWPRGTSSFDKRSKYRAGGSNIGTWIVLNDIGGYDYYGYNWHVYNVSRFDDGLGGIDSRIYVGVTEFPDTTFIILDSEDPVYHITYSYNGASRDSVLPTIVHPTFGELPITKRQLVDIHVLVDQTVVEELSGTGRLWSWMTLFIFAPGELLDVEGVPVCGDGFVPCGPGEAFDHWMNEPPFADTSDYHYTWNVENADAFSEGLATLYIKGRDTAGNLAGIQEGIPEIRHCCQILIDITAPDAPDETKITICDDGTVIGEAGAVGLELYSEYLDLNSLRVLIYSNSILIDILAEFWAENDGSFIETVAADLESGDVVYVTAVDHAGNESDATPVTVTSDEDTCQVSFRYEMDSKWNMVSVPMIPEDDSLSILFPDTDPFAMWRFENDIYTPAVKVEVGEGYWLLYSDIDTEEITGLPVHQFQRDLVPGWNMVGSCIEDVDIATIVDASTGQFPTWIESGSIWKYENSGYLLARTIPAGRAVWMFAKEAGTITVACGHGYAAAPMPVIERAIEPVWLSSIIIQSEHESRILEFGAREEATSSYDHRLDRPAPPPAPSADFRAYFTSKSGFVTRFWRDVRGRENDFWRLHIEAQSGINLMWDVTAIPQERAVRLRTGEIDVDMRTETCINMIRGSHDIDIIVKTIPRTFDLAQNYPNPFNSGTEIRYQIGIPLRNRDGNGDIRFPIHTILKIYNTLGQEVRTLLDEIQEPGHYITRWDGKDRHGKEVVSGIYLYRLKTGNFTKTKSMVLLK